jgi:hypothetical protein
VGSPRTHIRTRVTPATDSRELDQPVRRIGRVSFELLRRFQVTCRVTASTDAGQPVWRVEGRLVQPRGRCGRSEQTRAAIVCLESVRAVSFGVGCDDSPGRGSLPHRGELVVLRWMATGYTTSAMAGLAKRDGRRLVARRSARPGSGVGAAWTTQCELRAGRRLSHRLLAGGICRMQ